MTYEEELKTLHSWYFEEDNKIMEKYKDSVIMLDGPRTQEGRILRKELGKRWKMLNEKYGIK